MLTLSQIDQFHNEGYLFVDQAVLGTDDVLKTRQLADGLVASWQDLPRWTAPNVAGEAPILEVKYADEPRSRT